MVCTYIVYVVAEILSDIIKDIYKPFSLINAAPTKGCVMKQQENSYKEKPDT